MKPKAKVADYSDSTPPQHKNKAPRRLSSTEKGTLDSLTDLYQRLSEEDDYATRMSIQCQISSRLIEKYKYKEAFKVLSELETNISTFKKVHVDTKVTGYSAQQNCQNSQYWSNMADQEHQKPNQLREVQLLKTKMYCNFILIEILSLNEELLKEHLSKALQGIQDYGAAAFPAENPSQKAKIQVLLFQILLNGLLGFDSFQEVQKFCREKEALSESQGVSPIVLSMISTLKMVADQDLEAAFRVQNKALSIFEKNSELQIFELISLKKLIHIAETIRFSSEIIQEYRNRFNLCLSECSQLQGVQEQTLFRNFETKIQLGAEVVQILRNFEIQFIAPIAYNFGLQRSRKFSQPQSLEYWKKKLIEAKLVQLKSQNTSTEIDYLQKVLRQSSSIENASTLVAYVERNELFQRCFRVYAQKLQILSQVSNKIFKHYHWQRLCQNISLFFSQERACDGEEDQDIEIEVQIIENCKNSYNRASKKGHNFKDSIIENQKEIYKNLEKIDYITSSPQKFGSRYSVNENEHMPLSISKKVQHQRQRVFQQETHIDRGTERQNFKNEKNKVYLETESLKSRSHLYHMLKEPEEHANIQKSVNTEGNVKKGLKQEHGESVIQSEHGFKSINLPPDVDYRRNRRTDTHEYEVGKQTHFKSEETAKGQSVKELRSFDGKAILPSVYQLHQEGEGMHNLNFQERKTKESNIRITNRGNLHRSLSKSRLDSEEDAKSKSRSQLEGSVSPKSSKNYRKASLSPRVPKHTTIKPFTSSRSKEKAPVSLSAIDETEKVHKKRKMEQGNSCVRQVHEKIKYSDFMARLNSGGAANQSRKREFLQVPKEPRKVNWERQNQKQNQSREQHKIAQSSSRFVERNQSTKILEYFFTQGKPEAKMESHPLEKTQQSWNKQGIDGNMEKALRVEQSIHEQVKVIGKSEFIKQTESTVRDPVMGKLTNMQSKVDVRVELNESQFDHSPLQSRVKNNQQSMRHDSGFRHRKDEANNQISGAVGRSDLHQTGISSTRDKEIPKQTLGSEDSLSKKIPQQHSRSHAQSSSPSHVDSKKLNKIHKLHLHRLKHAIKLCHYGQYVEKRHKSSDGGEERFLRLTEDDKCLELAVSEAKLLAGSKKTCTDFCIVDAIDMVHGVIYGRATETLNKHCSLSLGSYLCFSILLENRTLDFYTPEERDMEFWIPALDHFTSLNRPALNSPKYTTEVQEFIKPSSRPLRKDRRYSLGRLLWKRMLLKMQSEYLEKDKKRGLSSCTNASAIISFANKKLGLKIKLKKEGYMSKIGKTMIKL